ncbi:MAG: DNA recombination protein RmuC, partial [Gammaproteobacteria bacterium]|nr:DNA recombination protein RmuC [Gammaproteobacteria bacterium]
DKNADLGESSIRLREQISRLQGDLSNEQRQFEEKLALLENAREQMNLQFKELANEILEDKSKKFTATNQENISQILKPLQEKIQHFEKRVEETYDRESKERFSLGQEIKRLQELNSRISEDAVNLTNALKGDNKAQGTWGEMILESILEKSGLVRGREYETQVSLKAVDGSRSQPDVVVHLPESRDIIIDAKVSLKAYEAYCNEDQPDQKTEYLKQHVQSMRNHIKLLSSKEYQNLMGVNSLDFVFLFMPIEASFSIAEQQDANLAHNAYEKNIIIIGPSTLFTTLRIVQNLWRQAQQNQNALEIASKAGALYDKFVGFVDDLEEVGGKIDATRKSYERAHNKLISGRGNLIGRVEKIKQLGAKTSKKHSDEVLQAADLEMQPETLPGAVIEDKSGSREPH